MDNPFADYAQRFAGLFEEYSRLQTTVSHRAPLKETNLTHESPLIMIFAPHPDDECIMGLLPLRMKKDMGARVINVAVTLGSLPTRRQERYRELVHSCQLLGFEILSLKPDGLTDINIRYRSENKKIWVKLVELVAAVLDDYRPDIVLFPHCSDRNKTHQGVHYLLRDALLNLSADLSPLLVQTEFWAPLQNPNLMVECDAKTLGELIFALSQHKKEILRNPYHLRLPAWMMDNVRRGSELIAGQGGRGADFVFAVLYQLSMLKEKEIIAVNPGNPFVGANQDLNCLCLRGKN